MAVLRVQEVFHKADHITPKCRQSDCPCRTFICVAPDSRIRGHRAAEKYRDWRRMDMPRMWSLVKEKNGKPDAQSRKRAREDTPPKDVREQDLPSTPGRELSLEVPRALSPLPPSPTVSVGTADPVPASTRRSRSRSRSRSSVESQTCSRSQSSAGSRSRSISVGSNTAEEQAVAVKPEPEVTDDFL